MGKRAVFKLFYCISIVITFILAGITLAGAFSGQIHWLCLYRPCIAGIIADKSYLTYLLDHTAPYMVTYPPYRHPWQLGIPEPDYSVLFSEYS